jgi:hypothetical protein
MIMNKKFLLAALASTFAFSAASAIAATNSDLPPACENYMKEVNNYLESLPEMARAHMGSAMQDSLNQTRDSLKTIPDNANKEMVCNQALETFKQATAGMASH